MNYLDELIERYPVLSGIRNQITTAYEILAECYENGGTLLLAGNGGSAADAEHIVGELMKGFVKPRKLEASFQEELKKADVTDGSLLAEKLQRGLPAIALTGHPSLSTAYLNDVDGTMIFAQQTLGYGKKGDVLLGISTSGNSQNVRYAMTVAKALGMKTIGLSGRDGGRMKEMADVTVIVPETETFKIQELHLPVYHALCLMLEERFF
ncbi:SIS domain-containing protein [Clostridium sp. E02]|uniref:D-sedoheptulose-7-phosphate isomerase n=1 Tax=Clostridium sp. E02 TaxID=2487134 RepID=UPI00325B4953